MTTAPLQAIFFDLDGTLLDTAPDFAHCLNRLLANHGAPPLTVTQMRYWVTGGVKAMVTQAFNIEETDPLYLPLKAAFLSTYEEILGQYTAPFPGLTQLLTALAQHAIPWGIITNKPAQFAAPLIQRFQLDQQAHCLVYGDTLPQQKPHPAPLHYACEQLHVTPSACCYVGDAITDMMASQSANMQGLLAGYGYLPEADKAHWSTKKTINALEELHGYLR